MLTPPLLLASTSRYRADLLGRLRLPFSSAAPGVAEAALPGESSESLVRRLALAKAEAVAARNPGAWVIGSDQTAECGGLLLGKPGTPARAADQLLRLSGQRVRFLTAVALVRDGRRLEALDLTTVQFRELDVATVQRYLAAEDVLDCAGSFKCEGLGISLFEGIESRDPTGLIGLPLIATAALLREAGYRLP